MDYDEIYFIGGTNFHNEKLKKCKKTINRDADIKRLLRLGKIKFYYAVLLMLFIIGSIVYYFTRTVQTSGAIISAIFILAIAKKIYNFVSDLRENKEYIKYCKFVLSGVYPKNPLEIWGPISGGLPDSQPLSPLVKLFSQEFPDKNINFVYAGSPYYSVKYINRITLKFNCNPITFIKNYYKYLKFWVEYSIKTVVSYADGVHIAEEDGELNISDYVFGIPFINRYLYKVYANKDSISVKIKDEDNKVDGVKRFTKLALNPEKFSIESNEYDIKVQDIDNYGYNNREKRSSIFRKISLLFLMLLLIAGIMYFYIGGFGLLETGIYALLITAIGAVFYKIITFLYRRQITIPVKRFYVVPDDEKTTNKEDNASLKTKLYKEENKEKLLITLGGAEVNLAFVDLINHYRWENSNNYKVGIAEDRFEKQTQRDIPIRLGTENLAYAIIKDNVIARRHEEDNEIKKIANLISFQLQPNSKKNKRFLSIYGYHGATTKIAACKLIYAFKKYYKDGKKYCENYIPWESSLTNQVKDIDALEYNSNNSFGGLLDAWDANDIINSEADDFISLMDDLEYNEVANLFDKY